MHLLGSLLYPTLPQNACLPSFTTETAFRTFFVFLSSMSELTLLIWSEKSFFPFIRRPFINDKYKSSPTFYAVIKLSTTFFSNTFVSSSVITSLSGLKRVSSIPLQIFFKQLLIIDMQLYSHWCAFFMICYCI